MPLNTFLRGPNSLWVNKTIYHCRRHQNTIEEINRDYVRENGIEVVRRISGGGAVYHDLNNLNYTIISKEDENKADFKSFNSSYYLAQLKLKLSSQAMTLRLMVRSSVAMFQAYINGRIMHHGCLPFNVDLSSLLTLLRFQRINLNQKV